MEFMEEGGMIMVMLQVVFALLPTIVIVIVVLNILSFIKINKLKQKLEIFLDEKDSKE